MNNMDWTNFSGEEFQSFCNTLLSFEISKKYVPFTAPGKDGGIDGIYEGKYDDKVGKWRFQYKFHSPETGRSASISLLKNDIKKDLLKNIKDETVLVFVTNVEINPQQRKELLLLAKDIPNIEFDIWDGAKLNVLVAKYPLLHLTYNSGAKYYVQDYKEYFSDQLEPTDDKSYSHSNHFYYRETHLEKLDKFILADDKKAFIIGGEGGIGKTRLCIEFFQKFIEPKENWIPLVFISHQLNFELLHKAFSGKKNYIVLLDDAHRYASNDLIDLIEISRAIKPNKVKFLLTARTHYLQSIIKELKQHDLDRISFIKLDKFNKTETKKIIQTELQNYDTREYINYFISLTNGKPLVLKTLFQVIKSGLPLNKINADNFLINYVNTYVGQLIDRIKEEHGFNINEVKRIIHLFALIEPLQIYHPDNLNQISVGENIPLETVRVVINDLQRYELISGAGEYSIKPDLYSDIILVNKLKQSKWLEETIPKYSQFLDNVVKNLNGIEVGEKADYVSYINKIFNNYADVIDQCSDQFQLGKILETINYITYSKPSIAVKAIEKVLNIFLNSNHLVHTSFKNSMGQKDHVFDPVKRRLKEITLKLNEIEEFSQLSVELTYKLFDKTKDEDFINNISNYNSRDFYSKYKSERQNSIYIACKDLLKTNDLNKNNFAIKCITNLLKLEHTDFEADYIKSNSIHIRTCYVPENPNIKTLRKNCATLLFSFCKRTKIDEAKNLALDVILDIPAKILSAKKNKYDGEDEITKIIDSIEKIAKQDLSISQKQSIKDKFYLYKLWKINTKHSKRFAEIEKALSKNDLTEVILDLFNPRNIREFRDEENWKVEKAKSITEKYSIEDIARSLTIILKEGNLYPHNIYFFLHHIATDNIRGKRFLEIWWATDPDYVLTHCVLMVRNIYIDQLDAEFYWKFIEPIRRLETQQSKVFVLSVYESGFMYHKDLIEKAKKILSVRDQELIIAVLKDDNIQEYYGLASSIVTLFLINEQVALTQMRYFLKKCNERQLDDLLSSFDRLNPGKQELIEEIILSTTIQINSVYHLEKFLNGIMLNNGEDKICDYFLARMKYKMGLMKKQDPNSFGYKVVPTNSNYPTFQNVPHQQLESLFSKIFRWFVVQDFGPYSSLYSTGFLSFFLSAKYISVGQCNLYSSLIKKNKNNDIIILRIAQSLSIFTAKNDMLFDILSEVVLLSSKNSNKKIEKDIYFAALWSATHTGLKSGVAGQPFAVDVAMKETVMKYIGKKNFGNLKLSTFFSDVLKNVQESIDMNTETEEETW